MSFKLANSYKILCVDDNENNLFTLDALLNGVENTIVVKASSAKDGLKVLLKENISLILLDIQMPVMNGFEMAKLLRKNKRTKDIPIIFITAVFKSEEFVKEGYELGAVDYLTKPIDDNQLLNKLSLYLKIFNQNNKLEQSQKYFYNIAQSIGDGIYTLDTNNKTTFINNEALRLLGFKEHELLGKSIHDFIHYKDINENPISVDECKIHSVAKDDEIYKEKNTYLVKKDSSFLNVSIKSTPLYIDDEIVGSVTIFSDKTKQNLIDILEKEKFKTSEQVIHSMVDMIESKDIYATGHARRVASYCEMIAIEMDYQKKDIQELKRAAWLHDIGKISTPDNILLKPDILTSDEYIITQEHLNNGYEILKKIDQYNNIARIMSQHHERYDGSGYPNGLKADEIEPLSRILILADAFDAMTTDKIYKPKKTLDEAFIELEDLSGKQFHPEVVSSAVRVLKISD